MSTNDELNSFQQMISSWGVEELVSTHFFATKQGVAQDKIELMNDRIMDLTAGGQDREAIERGKQAAALGYVLFQRDAEIGGGWGIRVVTGDDYTPELYQQGAFGDGDWHIQTTSYGTSAPEKVEQIIDGYQRAMKMVELLNSL